MKQLIIRIGIYIDLTAGSPPAFSDTEDPARELTNLSWGICPPKP